jgi:FkbM family methyltransferase
MLSQFIYYFGVWEPDISHWILERLTSGATFIDIGANVGYYSLLASTRVGPSGRVVAIEAAPLNYGNLLRNISINYLRNIRAVNVACWRCEDSLDLFCGPPSHSGITTVIPDFAANRGCEVFQKIQARPLASILTHEEATLARLVKIDVEGAEPEVIEGMKPLLNEFPESVEFIIEINPDQIASSGKTVETVLAPFLEGGFHVYQISNNYSPGSYLDRDLTSRIGSPVRVSLSSRLLESQCDVILSRLDQRNL